MRRRRFLGAAATVAVTGGAGCISVDAATATETHEFDVQRGTDLAVRNSLGSVTVGRGAGGPLEVRAEKRDEVGNEDALDDVRVETEASDGEFEVFVVDEREGNRVRATRLDLDVAVPPGVAVTAVTDDDGEVAVDGVGGDLTVRADDADVRVRNHDGDVTVRADDGDQTVRDISGDLSVDVDDGDVTAERVGGDVSVDVDDGDVTATDVDGVVSMTYGDGDVRAESVGAIGDVSGDDGTARLDIPAVRRDATVEVDDGTVTARLGTDLDARFVLETDNGDVDASGLDGRMGVEGDVDRLETVLGDGGNTLRIATDDGDVELRPLD